MGGSSGIGLQLTKQLAANGHQIHATYLKTKLPGNESIHYHPLNVLDEHVNLDFLPDSIDGLVYCPGSINLRPFARLTPQQFLDDFSLNTLGAIKLVQASLPRLKTSEHASIVLFSSVAVQVGLNFHTLVASSKGAIEGFARALAAELGPRIRVNCIAPSLTDTPLAASLLSSPEKREAGAQRHPLKKIGGSDDIANMAEFLLSAKAQWITGQIFHVDGGLSAIKM